MANNIETKTMTFKVFRFNSETDYLPVYKDYTLEVKPGEVMLDILNRIKWEHDGSFSYRRSCRHGICGSCAIKVNGKATLACKDRVSELVEIFGDELVIEPQDETRAIKDMVIDKGTFWSKYNTVQPYLKAPIDEAPQKENLVSPEQAEDAHSIIRNIISNQFDENTAENICSSLPLFFLIAETNSHLLFLSVKTTAETLKTELQSLPE